jgi:hypothetical protein
VLTPHSLRTKTSSTGRGYRLSRGERKCCELIRGADVSAWRRSLRRGMGPRTVVRERKTSSDGRWIHARHSSGRAFTDERIFAKRSCVPAASRDRLPSIAIVPM